MPDNNGKKEGKLLRALRYLSRIDWKGIALVLTAVGGLSGALWNKAEAWIYEQRTERTQGGAYALLARRVDELYQRVEACEPRLDEPAEASAPVEAHALADGPPAVPTPPVGVEYERARLPAFQIIQEQAGTPQNMRMFMDEMK